MALLLRGDRKSMSYFPLCIDLTDAPVLLVGNGPQIEEKRERLSGFRADIRCLNSLRAEDLDCDPVMVIVGDVPNEKAARYSSLCRQRNIPVNVVDMPTLCSFYFPALICRGELTVGISTGGKSPGFAACLRRRLEPFVPERSGEIIEWLYALRPQLKERLPNGQFRAVLGKITRETIERGRPLSEAETETIRKADGL